VTSTPEAITEAELADAFCRNGANGGKAASVLAAEIFAFVSSSREPEYEPGAMYRDANGDLWLYEPGASDAKPGSWAECPWLKPGSAGAFSLGSPERPLRRLVPEGSREAAVVLVTEWRGLGEQDHAVPPWRDGYRAALRKCADELEYALKHGGDL